MIMDNRKAVFEMLVPESCAKCNLCYITNKKAYSGNLYYKDYFCIVIYADVRGFQNERCPECPLKIIEDAADA